MDPRRLMRIYCLDTSSLVTSWHLRYPVDVFPTLWNRIDEWGKIGRILAPEEVIREIEKIEDDLNEWLRQRPYISQPPDEQVQREVRDILGPGRFSRLVDTKKGRSIADPWVIAQARVSKAVVVTEEKLSEGRSPKIPDVCRAVGIEYINVLELIRAMELKF